MVAKLVTWSITLSAVAALSLVGTAGKGPARDPGESLRRMLVAMGNGDYPAACEMTVEDGSPVEDGERSECARTLRVLAEGMRPSAVQRLRDVTVPDMSVRGARAQIRGSQVVGLPEPLSQWVISLVRVDDRWYVEAG